MNVGCAIPFLLALLSCCGASCPPPPDYPNVVIECKDNNRKIQCTEGAIPEGTVANYKCKEYYTSVGRKYLRRTCSSRGTWTNHQLLFCTLDCGKKEGSSATQIIHGLDTKRGEWPWHAAIYIIKGGRWEYSCGGSLVEDKFIVSASHCFTGDRQTLPFAVTSFKVVLGKYHTQYDVKDKFQQEFDVKELKMHESYSGNPIENDIAVAVLDRPAEISLDVRPVCLPRDWKIADSHLSHQTFGSIPGFGVTENGSVSDTLRLANIPYVKLDECVNKLPPHLRGTNFGPGFFCASLFNGTTTCQGDSGGGLVFPYGLSLEVRWYVEGLVSWGISIKSDDGKRSRCDPRVTFFTKVHHYMEWIDETIDRMKELLDNPNVPSSVPKPTAPPSELAGITCRNNACCMGLRVPNNTTGSGFSEYTSRCVQGGVHCAGNTGCAFCWCPRPFPTGNNVGNRPKCTLPC